jgi:hypothetical protein
MKNLLFILVFLFSCNDYQRKEELITGVIIGKSLNNSVFGDQLLINVKSKNKEYLFKSFKDNAHNYNASININDTLNLKIINDKMFVVYETPY